MHWDDRCTYVEVQHGAERRCVRPMNHRSDRHTVATVVTLLDRVGLSIKAEEA